MRSILFTVLLGTGCLNGDRPTEPILDYEGPGSEAWGEVDITCDASSDCLTDEACIDGICQVEKCTSGLAESSPPIGESLLFYRDAELAVADTQTYQGDYWIDGYAPGGGMSYDYSWSAGSSRIGDVAGGNFLGDRLESYAVITGQSKLSLLDAQGHSLNLDFAPDHLDAGDTDGDGLDEAVAVSDRGDTAVCDMDSGRCEYFSFSGAMETLDVAVGDIDGDTLAEIVYLVELDGYRYLYGVNLDYELTGQVEGWWYYPGDDNDNPQRIATGDLDGDRVEEVIGLWNDACWDWCDDSVRAWAPYESDEGGEFYEIAEGELDGYTLTYDLAVADTDVDERAEIYVIADGSELVEFGLSGSGTLQRRGSGSASVSGAPDRIAAADHDGDSPRAYRKGDAVPVEGAVLPIMVLTLPPYDKVYSDGSSSVGYGDGESVSESLTDTVSLGLSVDVGMGGDFWSIFGGKLSSRVSWYVSESETTAETLYQGSRYSIEADPDLYGPHYGAVVLGWGCFDAYTYEVDDPSDLIGEVDGEDFVMVVPTGGGVSLWSSSRYNAMAQAVGGLPLIEIPYEVGNVDSYPGTPERLDGTPIPADSLLFPNPTKYTVSDVGRTSWWDSVSETETNSESMGTDLSASASLTVAGVTIGGGTSYGWGQSYSLTVGTNAMFNGTLPAIPDDPSTPEDEYANNRYATTPYVYLHSYTDSGGNEAAFYVMTYTVER